jgi:hypothetical protein
MPWTTEIDHLFKMCKELKGCASASAFSHSAEPNPTNARQDALAISVESSQDKKNRALAQLRENARRKRSRFAH